MSEVVETTTINITPRWIDIVDIMLHTWKQDNLDSETRDMIRKQFHKMAKATDMKMKELKQGPYAKGGQYYEGED